MNLRHIDPRSTEWMETIEEMIAREDGDEEESTAKVKAVGTGGRLASAGSTEHAVSRSMPAAMTVSSVSHR